MREVDRRALGQRIRQVRQAAGLRQWELAERVGTTQSAVHKYENGAVPEAARLLEIARIGHTTVDWLLTGSHGEPDDAGRALPSDRARRLAGALQRLSGPDRERLEEAVGLLEAACGALVGKDSGSLSLENDDLRDTSRLLRTAREIQTDVFRRLLVDSLARLASGEEDPEDPDRAPR
jgi:transcriptional regulator with XRE-family HTH domain